MYKPCNQGNHSVVKTFIYHSETKCFELQNYVSHVLIQCQKRIHAVGADT